MNAQRRTPTVKIIAVIAILVVVASIAFPAWRTHQVQAHVAEALQAADAAKVVVMEAATVGGGLANLKASALAYNPAAATNPYVAGIVIADGGRITLTTTHTGATPDPVLVLVPATGAVGSATTAMTWTCLLAAGKPSAVPAACRTTDAPPARVATPASAATVAH